MLIFFLSTFIGSLIAVAIATISGLIGGSLPPHPCVYRYDTSRVEVLNIVKIIGVPVNPSLNFPIF
jgi:hypothetical protein